MDCFSYNVDFLVVGLIFYFWVVVIFLVGKLCINVVGTILKEFLVFNVVFFKFCFNICGFCYLNVKWKWVLKIIFCKNKGFLVYRGI